MNNYQAIAAMPPEQIEAFLDQVYLTGLNTGMYAATHKDDSVLDQKPFDARWLGSPAEQATALGSDETGDAYLLHALVEAILRSTGISPDSNG